MEGRTIMVTLRTPASAAPTLPQRANFEHLRKQAKARLANLRRSRPQAILADAQLEIARENGFPSWRALKAAFDRRLADGERAVGDWIGQPEGGVPVALRIRRDNGRLHAQLDVPSLGYFGDPIEGLSIVDDNMAFRVTVRAVNALYEGVWNTQAAEWQGVFTHDGRAMPLNFRRGALRAPRIEGLDGLWDASIDEGASYILRVVTDDKGTFAWLNSSAVPGIWFPAIRLDRAGSQVTLEMKTLRVEGRLDEAGDRIDGLLYRHERGVKASFVRRSPGSPAPGRETASEQTAPG